MSLEVGDLVRVRSPQRGGHKHRSVGRVVSIARKTATVQLFDGHKGSEVFDLRDVSLWKMGQAIDRMREEGRCRR